MGILRRVIVENKNEPLFLTVTALKENYCFKISIRIVRRYVRECVICNYAAVPKPYLSSRNILARKRWAYMDLNEEINQLGKVAFSDDLRVLSNFPCCSKSFGKRKVDDTNYVIWLIHSSLDISPYLYRVLFV